MPFSKKAILGLIGILLAAACLFLVFGQRDEQVRILYATGGSDYDQAAYLNFEQSLVPNLKLNRWQLGELGASKLRSYDAIVLDPSLIQSSTLQEDIAMLRTYVEKGGHLYVDHELIDVIPADLLGGSGTAELPTIDKPDFTYPKVDEHLQGFQDVFHEFANGFVENVFTDKMSLKDLMPGYKWGKTLVVTTAEPIVLLQDKPIVTLNRVGQGTVMMTSAFLPNRYFITGFDLKSGMNPNDGFAQKTKLHDESIQTRIRANYFDFKTGLPLQPYFNFSFAAANHLLRSEYAAFVSKETLGYSLKKVYGPYGRPAMAFQNHFEALPGFQKQEGIQWAELLKVYNQIPSFSLIRSSFNWWQWYEGIVVHLNTGTTAKPEFVGEFPNSFYSSGTHLLSGDKLLYMAGYPPVEGEETQLAMKLSLPYRAYPAFADLDGDGKLDLVVGSGDGTVTWFRNVGAKTSTQQVPSGAAYPDAFSAGAPVRLATGTGAAGNLRASSGYAAIAAGDLNGDGRVDLVVGGADGRVLAALQRPGGVFAAPVALSAKRAGSTATSPISATAGNAAPALGDVNGDGITDLVVGDQNGRVTLYRGIKGAPLRFEAGVTLVDIPAKYAAPSIKDLNADGKPDLAIGNSEGDVLVYTQLDRLDRWAEQGPITGKTNNQMGTKALVGGQFSVPVWMDLNHDGKEDLVVGQVEYSKPVTIDDPDFPFKQQLHDFIAYTKQNKLELYPHLFMHNYVSAEQEKEEIDLHRKAFAALGIPWTLTGTNQHTWRINNSDQLQTLRNENEADIWFNFGFKPPNDPFDPQWGQDFIWGFPFLLKDEALKHPMLLHTPGMKLKLNPLDPKKDNSDLFYSFAKLDMPIDYFEHIEYQDEIKLNELTEFAQFFDKLRSEYDYNFVSEPQMARATMAAMKSDIQVSRSWLVYLIDTARNRFGNGKHLTLSVKADNSNVPVDMVKEYRDAVGVMFEPGKNYTNIPFGTSSDIVMTNDKKMYVGLQGTTSVSVDWSNPTMHVERSNVPIKIKKSDSQWTINLLSEGMQQIKIFSPTPLRIEGNDLKIDSSEAENNYNYIVTHFGDMTSITLHKE